MAVAIGMVAAIAIREIYSLDRAMVFGPLILLGVALQVLLAKMELRETTPE